LTFIQEVARSQRLEPAYDGGDLEPTSLNEVRDDGYSVLGLLQDSDAGILGVDLNVDDALQDTEIIGAIDEDIPVAVAETDIEAGIEEEGEWVIALHAGPDTYETLLACGSLTDAETDDEDRRIVPLQPTGDANVFGFAVLEEGGQSIHTYIFQPGTGPAATPTIDFSGEAHPVDIHQGDCNEWTTEPAFDVGDMQVTNVAADGEQEPGDTEGTIPPDAVALGPVYKIDVAADFNGQQLLEDGPYIVGVHQSAEDYSTLVACGSVLPIIEGDNVIVPLQPVGETNQTGFVMMNMEGSDVSGFLWQCEPLEADTDPTPTPAPEPTPTPVPSAVIEETEIVPAPTATALAEEEEGD
jgi:hypothetical protein